MDDIKMHYNTSKSAQLQALAYAQGIDIHVAPGQEQVRVQPTMQLTNVIQ